MGLPDGSPGTIPVTATDIFGDEPVVVLAAAMSVEGIRALRTLIGSMKSQRRSSLGPKKRK